MPPRSRIPLLLSLVLLAPLPASAEMVKWVDEKGQVHYSDQPPSGKVKKVETLNIRTAPTSAPAEGGSGAAAPAAPRSAAEQAADFRKRRMEADEAAKKAEQDKQQAEVARQNCENARGSLRSLQEGARIFRYDEKGERVFLDDAARQQSIAEAQKAVSQWCK